MSRQPWTIPGLSRKPPGSGDIPALWHMEPSSRLRAYDGYRDVPPHQGKAYRSDTRSTMPFKHEEI